MISLTLAEVDKLGVAFGNARALPESILRDHQIAHLEMIRQRYIEEVRSSFGEKDMDLLERLQTL